MIDIDTIYTTLDDAYGSENVLDILIEFERALDTLDIYVYKNWEKGEIVEGPEISRYWITLTLMYPHKLMPDPDGAMRLIDHGCKVWMGQDEFKYVTKVKGPESYETDEDGELTPKIAKTKVWLVKISMPRHFVDEIAVEKEDIGGTTIDMDDVTQAYDEDLNSDEVAKGNVADETQQEISQ